ncbi:putative oxalocrotonate tautomerase [Xylogone sp. PMI_703]|nr:putative oxalocrotonate tautomerase [Xylogone sp. PMI_703]
MPLWTIYHPPNAFSDEQMKSLSEDITKIYTDGGVPKFYVGVLYVPVSKERFYMGAEPVGNFVRVKVDHMARTLPTPELQKNFVNRANAALKPYVADMGFDFEWHADETPPELWSIQGITPPPGGSEVEKIWFKNNKPSPY